MHLLVKRVEKFTTDTDNHFKVEVQFCTENGDVYKPYLKLEESQLIEGSEGYYLDARFIELSLLEERHLIQPNGKLTM